MAKGVCDVATLKCHFPVRIIVVPFSIYPVQTCFRWFLKSTWIKTAMVLTITCIWTFTLGSDTSLCMRGATKWWTRICMIFTELIVKFNFLVNIILSKLRLSYKVSRQLAYERTALGSNYLSSCPLRIVPNIPVFTRAVFWAWCVASRVEDTTCLRANETR